MALGARIGMAAAIALAGSASAQDSGRVADRALAPFVACRPVANPAARGRCYDAALEKLQQAVAERQVVIVDREVVSEDRRAGFGLGGPPLPPRRGTEAAAIDTTVVSATAFGYERWTIRVATGSLWRTSEPGLSVTPRAGMPVHIRRGIMGNYLLRIGRSAAVRADRIG